MKPVTAYEAFNGEIFKTAKECADHERYCIDMAKIVDTLPKFKATESFNRGLGYYQHNLGRFLAVRKDFIKLILTKYKEVWLESQLDSKKWLFNTADMFKLFRDKDDTVSLMASYWIGCIDDLGRQWAHPIFSNNKEQKGEPINDSTDLI